MFTTPVTFKEARDQLHSRMDTPTALKYERILEQWNADTRARAFFSARVAEASILGELHRRCTAITEGQMTKTQAVELLRRYFAGDAADPLAALGFAPPQAASGVAQLASYPRLELIMQTNTRMATECGQYQQWQAVKDVYKYGIWRCGYAKEHRHEHLERDGKAYPADHPIWTQSPPGGEFNCHCRRELATEEDIKEEGLKPQPDDAPFAPSSLGFDPSRSIAEPPPLGKHTPPAIARKAEQLMQDYQRQNGKNSDYKHIDMERGPFSPVQDETPEQAEQRIRKAGNLALDEIRQWIPGYDLAATFDVLEDDTEYNARKWGTHRLVFHDGKTTSQVKISKDTLYPCFVAIHELFHGVIDSGLITRKQLATFQKELEETEIYKDLAPGLLRHYGEKTNEEMAVRALAWFVAFNSKNDKISKGKIAILQNEDNLKLYPSNKFVEHQTVWRFNNNMNDKKLGEKMKKLFNALQKGKGILAKLFGKKFNDIDELPEWEKELEEYMAKKKEQRAKELGMTLEELEEWIKKQPTPPCVFEQFL